MDLTLAAVFKLLEFLWCMCSIQRHRRSKVFFLLRKWVNVNTTYNFRKLSNNLL